MSPPVTSVEPRWWGEFEIPQDQTGCWRIGPLTLWIERRRQEWRLAFCDDRETPEGRVEVACPCPQGAPEDGAEVVRAVGRHVDGRLAITPCLADRPIVARPETPFHLLAGEEVTLYVSTPVWVRVATVESPSELLDLPTKRLSDTWFGPSTRDGELCYAIRTAARLELANLSPIPERALTEVRIRNLADAFQVERLNLAVHRLSLFADAAGALWTQGLTIERHHDGQLGEVRFDDQPPEAAGPCDQVAEPRASGRGRPLLRALTGLLG